MHPRTRIAALAIPAMLCLAGCASNATPEAKTSSRDTTAAKTAAAPDNAELAALCAADQADRQTLEGADWEAISARDAAREARVHAMLEENTVRTPRDYFNAALICQHSSEIEGIQLAHELSMISAAMGGGETARWLMAASYDRLLNRLKEPQRFGTQYLSQNGEPVSLGEVRPGVTDSMRAALHVPTLAEAKAREAAMRAMTTSAK